jgi:hypothetical protein
MKITNSQWSNIITFLQRALVAVWFGNIVGCYSFTGSSVPLHLRTIAIPLFDDQSGSGEPNLREVLTNKLIERFRQDNSLEIADRTTADAILEGTIEIAATKPLVVTAGETVSKNRFTLEVKVMYQDMKLKKKIYEKKFSQIGDYDIGSGVEGRQRGIDAAIEKIADDILLETVSGW